MVTEMLTSANIPVLLTAACGDKNVLHLQYLENSSDFSSVAVMSSSPGTFLMSKQQQQQQQQ